VHVVETMYFGDLPTELFDNEVDSMEKAPRKELQDLETFFIIRDDRGVQPRISTTGAEDANHRRKFYRSQWRNTTASAS
jgi:hypothetical protein